jgi:hypothetical protein
MGTILVMAQVFLQVSMGRTERKTTKFLYSYKKKVVVSELDYGNGC